MELLKANRPFRTLRGDTSGVSPVIGAVLVFGLFSTGFLLWSFSTLPAWIADNEEARDLRVVEEFGHMKAGLDNLASAGSVAPVSITVPLGAVEVPLLQPVPSVGTLSVATGTGWTGAFTNTVTHLQGGVVLGTPQEDIDGDVLSDVTSFDALKVGLTTSGIAGADTAEVQASASNGTETVTIRAIHDGAPSGCSGAGVRVVVTATYQATSLYDQATCGFGSGLTDHTVDLLAPEYGFAGALDRLSGGYDVTFTDATAGGTVTGTVATVYRTATGTPQFLGTGIATGDIARTADGSNLRFDPVNLHHDDETIAWEAGAVLVDQTGSGTVAIDPSFTMSIEGSTGTLSWTVVQLTGSGDVTSGGSATATVTHRGTDHLLFASDGGDIVLTTAYPVSWQRFFRAETLASGAGADATVAQGTDTVTLSLTTGTTVTGWVIDLRIVQASVVVS